jgi:hypothetical protein
MADATVSLGTNQYLLLRVNEISTNAAANTSQVQTLLYLIRSAGSGAWSSYTNNSWSTNTDGQGAGGSGTYDLRGSGTVLLLNNIFTISHDPTTGAKTINASGSFSDPHGNIGSGSTSLSLALTTLPQVPSAPSLNSLTGITASQFTANFSAPSSIGGSAISGYTLQVSTDSTFATGVTSFTGSGSATSINATGLAAFTKYYARLKATNTQGDSAFSATLNATMAASGAPHLAVLPKWDDSGFWILTSAPFGVTGGVCTITRSVAGPGAPVPTTLSGAPGATIFDALVLAPGQTVTYQATLTIGGSTTGPSPTVSLSYSAVTVGAPLPPIFDGASVIPAPLGDTETAAWQGPANAAASIIYGKHPMGWRNFDQGANGLATGVVTQIDDSISMASGNGKFDVMALFGSVQSAAGVRVGTELLHPYLMAQVFGSVVYFGSILVEVDVQTRLAAEIEWYGTNGVLIGRSVGATVLVPANTPTTLVVSGNAPSAAAYAAVDSVDVAGSGWAAGSIRYAGSAMLSASAQYSYFDGDTTDTPAYSYSWQGASNASASLRTGIASTGGNSLQDPDDPVIPVAPSAPIVDDSQILTDIVWRRYVSAIPAANIRAWLVSVPTLILFTGANIERQVRIRYWKNPNNISAATWTDAGSTYDSEQIISYIPAGVSFVVDGVAERAYVDFPATVDTPAQTVAADHLLFGDGGGPAVWPELLCDVGYIITLDVPLTSVPGNITQVLELTDRLG